MGKKYVELRGIIEVPEGSNPHHLNEDVLQKLTDAIEDMDLQWMAWGEVKDEDDIDKEVSGGGA